MRPTRAGGCGRCGGSPRHRVCTRSAGSGSTPVARRCSAGWATTPGSSPSRSWPGPDERPSAVIAPERSPRRRGSAASARGRGLRTPVIWGVVWGCLQAGSPLAFFWLDDATVYALGLTLIAAVYIGFAVADGRPRIIAVETGVAAAFVVIAAVAVTGSAWLLVAGLAGHGLKDVWQHRTGFVANTRWWPPFCASVDVVAAALIAVAIVAGVRVGW